MQICDCIYQLFSHFGEACINAVRVSLSKSKIMSYFTLFQTFSATCISYKVQVKVLLVFYRTLCDLAPYLCELTSCYCSWYIPSQSHWLSCWSGLQASAVLLFQGHYADCSAWNSHPLDTCKSLLTCHFINKAYPA